MSDDEKSELSAVHAVMWAAIFIAVDVLFLPFYFMAFGALIVGTVSFLYFLTKRTELTRALCCFAIVVGVIAGNRFNTQFYAPRQSARVIDACERFRDDVGEYPETLEELVPQYLGRVPNAKLVHLPRSFAPG